MKSTPAKPTDTRGDGVFDLCMWHRWHYETLGDGSAWRICLKCNKRQRWDVNLEGLVFSTLESRQIMAVTDPDVRLTDRLTEEGAAVISHARIAVDDGFDSYIERLREVYPPPHPAIQIAMEVKAILTTQAESQRDEV